MKLSKLALAPIAAAAMMAFGAPATANTLLFQGVTFTTSAVGNTLTFSIDNALNATGDWVGVDHLNAFSLKDFGDVTGVTSINPNDLTFNHLEMNVGGCVGGASGGACFTASPSPILLTNHMSWDITFTGTGLHFDAPHLKVLFSGGDVGNGHGSLLSQTVPAIPEPETYAMMLVGFGLLGFVARRRKQSLGSLATA